MGNVLKSEFLIVAEQVLSQAKRPMRPSEIVDHAFQQGLFSHRVSGRTPFQTMKSKLSVHVRRTGEDSIFVRTAPGQFYLRRLLDESQTTYNARPQHKPPPKEQVLVFPSGWLDATDRFQGIREHWKRTYRTLLRPSVCRHMGRLTAEQDNSHKQVLTYVMLTRGRSVLAYKRGNFNRVEDFLRGSHCIGFGGHVGHCDADLFNWGQDMGVTRSAVRELCEEVRMPDRDRERLRDGEHLEIVGLLNDDSSEVGRRHFAFVCRYEVSDDPQWDRPERGEKSITQLRWLSPASNLVPVWDFEYWSQLCLRRFFPDILQTAPTFRVIRRTPLMPPHVLCVMGAVGSGKSEATGILTREFGYKEINTGRLVAKLLALPPVPRTPRAQFQAAAWQFIQTPDGPDRLAKAIYDQLSASGDQRILVDGIRHRQTLERLRQYAGQKHVGVLYIHTPPDLAYDFYRDREAPSFSIYDFLGVRNAPVEREVEGLITESDAVLYNWTGRRAYQQATRQLMTVLLGR